ncbi:secreted protein/lipoprotein [Streptomyces sp. NPDC056549]|uniref:secreted protein/lipoprotein n=1 Tax=Streptomyces sp. NPDC056549 TaxID=3345864 RepID=UPI0036C72099
MEKVYADKSGKAGDLKLYAASAALSRARSDAASLHQRDLVSVGTVTVRNPIATQVETERQIPHVILSSCLDITQWQTINARTRKPATLPENRLVRYVIKATVERWPEGWRVIRDEPQGKRC